MVLNHGTNVYINNFKASREQQLLEDLIIESIKMYGQDMIYLPREIVSLDELYTEDDQSKYTKAFPIEMYIKSVDGFQGDGVFLSKFGLEIRDQVTFTVAKRIFEEEVGTETDQFRPNEGDVIYFPLNAKLFVIRYVDYKPFFYQLGSLQTYDLICELFEYSGEIFDTGYDYIDEIQSKFSLVMEDYAVLSEDGKIILSENNKIITSEKYKLSEIVVESDNDHLIIEQQEGTENDQQYSGNNSIIDWTYTDPFSEGTYAKDTLFLNNYMEDRFRPAVFKGKIDRWKNLDLCISGGIENIRDSI